jgi:DNA-binding ferritin-like protein
MTPLHQTYLLNLLAALEALSSHYRAAHWQCTGPSSYSDHLLFEKLYKEERKEIDTLAEKIVELCGNIIVPRALMRKTSHILMHTEGKGVLKGAMILERGTMYLIEDCYNCLDDCELLSMGWDDYLMGLVNSHENHMYLIKQRLNV